LAKDIIIDICSNKVLVEENNIVVNHSLLDLDTFFLFYKYLQNKEEFKNKFSEDGYKQLLATIADYINTQQCSTCKVLLGKEEEYRVCYECKSFFHVKCKIQEAEPYTRVTKG
jgi:hypothetical protein